MNRKGRKAGREGRWKEPNEDMVLKMGNKNRCQDDSLDNVVGSAVGGRQLNEHSCFRIKKAKVTMT